MYPNCWSRILRFFRLDFFQSYWNSVREEFEFLIIIIGKILLLSYARWNHHKSFELSAPLTFWVPDIFQAWNQNLIMKYGLPDQFLCKEISRFIQQKVEKLQFWIKTLRKRPTTIFFKNARKFWSLKGNICKYSWLKWIKAINRSNMHRIIKVMLKLWHQRSAVHC